MASLSDIRLVISDVDGTLVTPDKQLTPRAAQAIDDIRAAGLRFAIASSRPVRGLARTAAAARVDTPLSGFNGGRIVAPDGEVLEDLHCPGDIAGEIVGLLADMGLDVWVFSGDDWLVTNPDGPRVDHARHSLAFDPLVVTRFDTGTLAGTNQIVGISMDFPLVERAEAVLNARYGTRLSATRSQPFYLDITHREANKGHVVRVLAEHYGLSTDQVATIGDSDNDVLMFRASGYSFAMGNATEAVKAEASDVTAPNTEEGFARAMQRLLEMR